MVNASSPLDQTAGAGTMGKYRSNLFAELGLNLEGEDLEGMDDADLLELLDPCDHLPLEWQEVGVLHTLGQVRIQEVRTFAYDDTIMGNSAKAMCRLKDFCFQGSDLKLAVREIDFDNGVIGFRVWDAAVVLTYWLYENADRFRGKAVMEIGSGCGLPGMMAANYAGSVVLSDSEPALLDNLLTCVAMNYEEETATYFPTKLTCVPGATVESTACLGPKVCLSCKGGREVAVCKVNFDLLVDAASDREVDCGLFDLVFGSDVSYSEELGRSVARVCCSLLAPFGEAVVVSPEERVGNCDCLVEFMKLGRVLSVNFITHGRQMTPQDYAETLLGRKPSHCKRNHMVIHFAKCAPSLPNVFPKGFPP